jgi:hypothetical protein
MRQAQRKKAEEYNKQEILEWVGVGPKKEGRWELTAAQLKFFTPHEKGIVHCVAAFRYTQWEITENGSIRWEPTTRKAWIAAQPKALPEIFKEEHD